MTVGVFAAEAVRFIGFVKVVEVVEVIGVIRPTWTSPSAAWSGTPGIVFVATFPGVA